MGVVRTSSLRLSGLIVVSLFLLALSPGNPVDISSVHRVYGTDRTISMVGFGGTGWNNTNPAITIVHGDTVELITTSGDGATHQFFVDVDGDGFPNCNVDKCAYQTSGNGWSRATLGGFFPGNYTYYCAFHALSMLGFFTVKPPPSTNFFLTPNPFQLGLFQGTWTSSNITVSSLNGFSGTVTFSPPSAPEGFVTSLSSPTVQVTPSSPGRTILDFSVDFSVSQGLYTVSVTGSNGANSQTLDIPVSVSTTDFAFYSGGNMPILAGSSKNWTLHLFALGFTGSVNLTAAVSSLYQRSTVLPRVSLSPSTVSIDSVTQSTSNATIDTVGVPLGEYNITITAVSKPSPSHSITHSITLRVSIWSLSSSPPAPSIPPWLLGLVVYAIAMVLLAGHWVLTRRREKKSGVGLGREPVMVR